MTSLSFIARLIYRKYIVFGSVCKNTHNYKNITPRITFHSINIRTNLYKFSSHMQCSALHIPYHAYGHVTIRHLTSMASAANNIVSFPKPIVICGPSGVGKSTIIKRLMIELPNIFGFSVSHTTRKPRDGEIEGINYHFISKKDFLQRKKQGDFIETAEFSGNLYATSKMAIQSIQDKGQICILDLEMNGVRQIKESLQEIEPCYIFIRPPSIEDLEKRLKERKSETNESLEKRLNAAKVDLEFVANSNMFDIVIVNDEIDTATEQLKVFILGDRHR